MAKSPPQAVIDEEDISPETEPSSLLNLTDLLGFQLRMAQAAMHRDFLATLSGLDLTQKVTAVLILLEENPGMSQMSLSNLLSTDRATIMAMVSRMEERGLIYRTPSQVDRRRQELYLTDAGVDLLQRAKALIKAHEERFKSLFNAEELESLMAFLRRMYSAD